MLGALSSLTFTAPLALLVLAVLPVLWLLLRLVPPAPKRITFPPVAILARIRNKEDSAVRTPPWLILLRILLVTLAVLAAAGPLLNPSHNLGGSGPMLIVIDDGWSAAGQWDRSRETLAGLLDRAAAQGRPVAVLTTAGGQAFPETGFGAAKEIATMVATLRPKAWSSDPGAVLERLEAEDRAPAADGLALWLSDGLAHDGGEKLAETLNRWGAARIHAPTEARRPLILDAPTGTPDGLDIRLRAMEQRPTPPVVRAVDSENRVLARRILEPRDDGGYGGELPLPLEQRNRVERLEVEGEPTAASVFLVDERWRRRAVGLAGAGGSDEQPLLSEHYYLRRALAPYVELREGRVDELLARPLSLLVLPDSIGLAAGDFDRVKAWISEGGVLLRFAGPRVLGDPGDDLYPEQLLPTSRNLEGGMSWSSATGIDRFPEGSPLEGLAIPGDIKINRQALTRPSPNSKSEIWARLIDRTPLISALKLGDGWSVMVHVPANNTWSNLPLSGLFVEILRRLSAMSRGYVSDEAPETLRPERTLDGFGRLEPAPAAARPIIGAQLADLTLSASHPPGFYTDQGVRRAINLGPRLDMPMPMPASLGGLTPGPMEAAREKAFAPWLWALALALLAFDGLFSLALRGGTGGRVPVALVLAVGVSIGFPIGFFGLPAGAQDMAANLSPVDLAGQTRFAYLLTGDGYVDNITRSGLAGLTEVLAQRSAAELAPPVGVDPERDVLDFFPMIYWSVPDGARPLSTTAVDRLNRFMEGGGMLVIDTRGTGLTLRGLVDGLRVPPLRAVPQDHVLTRSFFLINEFPGRYKGSNVWVARDEAQSLDGVSQVVIGDHDWVGAWARDTQGQPMLPVVPDGDTQREWSLRFGVNLAMYVLTGNYKADQVHLPIIMERLGL